MHKKSSETKNNEFSIVKKGYAQHEVDQFFLDLSEKYSKAIKQSNATAQQLKEEVDMLRQENTAFKAKEADITNALIIASNKAQEMSDDIKLKYAMELDRLKLFRKKWENSYNEMSERYHFSKDAINLESVVASTCIEIEKFLQADFLIERKANTDKMHSAFRQEVDRLTTEKSMVDELTDKIVSKSVEKDKKSTEIASTFMPTTEDEIDQILRDLGVM